MLQAWRQLRSGHARTGPCRGRAAVASPKPLPLLAAVDGLCPLGAGGAFRTAQAVPIVCKASTPPLDGMRTVLELQGTPCIPMEEEQDQLIFFRSFSTPITTTAGLRQVRGRYIRMGACEDSVCLRAILMRTVQGEATNE